MEVRGSNSSSSGSYYSLPSSGGGSSPQTFNTTPRQRDQIESFSSHPRYTPRVSVRQQPSHEELYKRWGSIRTALLWFGVGALLLSLLLTSLPILAIIFSFGTCLVGNCQEWWEFTCSVFGASLWPAGSFVLSTIACVMVSMRMSKIAYAMPQDPMATDPLRFLARRK